MPRNWQDEFLFDIQDMSNRELFDMYVTMCNGTFWHSEGIDPKHPGSVWMYKETEAELDFRLKDWLTEE